MKKIINNILCLILILSVSFSFSACSNSKIKATTLEQSITAITFEDFKTLADSTDYIYSESDEISSPTLSYQSLASTTFLVEFITFDTPIGCTQNYNKIKDGISEKENFKSYEGTNFSASIVFNEETVFYIVCVDNTLIYTTGNPTEENFQEIEAFLDTIGYKIITPSV